MIQKPTILITSLGRTGTKFFASMFRELIPDCTSLHEPDLLTTTELRHDGEGFRSIITQLSEAGYVNMLIRKPLGNWGVGSLSDARVTGKLPYDDAVDKVIRQRKRFVESRPGSVYVESNGSFYGLIDVANGVFVKHTALFLVRDGRNWVRSWMNMGSKGGMYTKGRVRSIVAHTWPTARDLENDAYSSIWHEMSRFKRLCWAWNHFNGYALSTIAMNPNARLYRFEEIFQSDSKIDTLMDLIAFATSLDSSIRMSENSVEKWIRRKIHKGEGDFPAWEDWSEEQKKQFNSICGELMKELGYGSA